MPVSAVIGMKKYLLTYVFLTQKLDFSAIYAIILILLIFTYFLKLFYRISIIFALRFKIFYKYLTWKKCIFFFKFILFRSQYLLHNSVKFKIF